MIAYEVRGSVALVTLDAPPLNTMTFELLERLREAIARANADDEAQGIVIAGSADHFSAGADVNLFQQALSREAAIELSRTFQSAFQVVADSEKPVVAACAGRMMGGAVELALACHRRACTHAAKFNMPEVNLGIVAGAGGTQRLPRCIGVEPALRMLLTAKPITASEALALKLVDEVCLPGELIETASRLAQQRKPAEAATRPPDDRECQWAEDFVAKTHSELTAPAKTLEVVRAGIELPIDEAFTHEQRAFADCVTTRAAQNKFYLFFARRKTSKLPELDAVQPQEVRRAAVVGMGTMGTGIAHALAIAGVPVTVIDSNPTAAHRGVARIEQSVRGRVDRGRMTPETADRLISLITPATDWSDLADVDVVCEAIVEDLSIKQMLFSRLEAVCRNDAILATNTSTISLDRLAADLNDPSRLIGLHFFNPAHRMPLVEVIRHDSLSSEVLATSMRLAKQLRKTALPVKNREGFLVNRIFIPYLKEAFWLLEEGARPAAVDEAMVAFGFPMGPLALIDMAGIDILVATDRVLNDAIPRHGPLSQVAARLAERGQRGQKSGAGVYIYEQGRHTPLHSESTARLIAEIQNGAGHSPRTFSREEITDRLVLRMVAEAIHVQAERLVGRDSDIDVGTVLGVGFPDFRGGVLKYARDRGVKEVAARLEQLQTQCGERYSR
jgi:3-hydroxyacyl-CoA dehydrogenase